MNKRLWVLDSTLPDQKGPHLSGKIKTGVDVECFGDVDAAIGLLRRVI